MIIYTLGLGMKLYYIVSPVSGKGTITANGGNGYCAGQRVCTTKFNKQFKVCVMVENRPSSIVFAELLHLYRSAMQHANM